MEMTGATAPISVLLVEDDPDHAEMVHHALTRLRPPFEVTVTRDGAGCLEALASRPFSVVLLDYWLPQADGLKVLKDIQARGFDVPVVMITGQGDERQAVAAVDAGALDYIMKTRGYVATLPAVVRKVVTQHAVARENARLQHEADTRLKETETLLTMSEVISSTLEPVEVLRRTCREMVRILGADFGVAWLLDRERRQLDFASGYHIPKDVRFLAPVLPVVAGHVLVDLAARLDGPVWSSDSGGDPRFDYPYLDAVPHKSVLVHPLRSRGRTTGVVVVVWTRDRHHFTDEELRLATGLARQASLAVERAGLHAELQQRLRQTETLLAVSHQVGGTLEVEEAMRQVAREVARALDADMAGAYLADPARERLTAIAGYHVPRHLLEDFRSQAIPLKGHRILEEAFASQEPVVLADVAADPRVDQGILQRFRHRSGLFCPMVAQGVSIGGLFVVWFEREHRFTEAEIRLVQAVARQAAVELANARLVEELRARQAGLEAVLRTSRQLSRIEPVTSLLGHIAEASGQLVGANSVVIRVVEGTHLEVGAVWGDVAQSELEPRIAIGQSLSGRVAGGGVPIMAMEPADDPRLIPAHRRWATAQSAYLGVPIRMGERLAGVLGLMTRRPEGFSHADLATITALAAQAAVALENARLYQELRQSYDELSQTQSQLVQAQKMEAVGQLAGGVAHDFNNLLLIILGYARLLLDAPSTQEVLAQRVGEIKKAADRATVLTRQLLAFSRRQALQMEVLDLNLLVGETSKMLRRLIGEGITLVTVLGDDVGRVKADPGQIEQSLMNLVLNARDAISGGGRITVETARAEPDDRFLRAYPDAPGGPLARITVRDTGHGMSPEVQARVFEPFFTTKEQGRGSGLGLSTVFGIIKQHGGQITVESQPGAGTTFAIYLPRVELPLALPVREWGRPLSRGTERVLVVEDERSVLDLVQQVLTRAGYEVTLASSPGEALRLYADASEAIDLVLTDVVMPGMSGLELVRRLEPLRPGLRVLYMSGYPDAALGPEGSLEPGMAFMRKPFTPEGLCAKVREVLDEPARR